MGGAGLSVLLIFDPWNAHAGVPPRGESVHAAYLRVGLAVERDMLKRPGVYLRKAPILGAFRFSEFIQDLRIVLLQGLVQGNLEVDQLPVTVVLRQGCPVVDALDGEHQARAVVSVGLEPVEQVGSFHGPGLRS